MPAARGRALARELSMERRPRWRAKDLSPVEARSRRIHARRGAWRPDDRVTGARARSRSTACGRMRCDRRGPCRKEWVFGGERARYPSRAQWPARRSRDWHESTAPRRAIPRAPGSASGQPRASRRSRLPRRGQAASRESRAGSAWSEFTRLPPKSSAAGERTRAGSARPGLHVRGNLGAELKIEVVRRSRVEALVRRRVDVLLAIR